MNNNDDELINIIKCIENEFDTSFKCLLKKCTEFTNVNCFYCNECDKTISNSHHHRNNNNNQEVKNDDDYDDDDDDEEDESKTSQSLTFTDDYSNNEKNNDGDGNGNGDGDDKNEQNETLIEQLKPELIRIALSEAKLMIKTYLLAERTKQMKQKIERLEMENFHLRNRLKSTVWCNSIVDLDDGENDDDKLSHGYGDDADAADKCDAKNDTNTTTTNLIMLKCAIEQEIQNYRNDYNNYNDYQQQQREQNKQLRKQQRYENKIYGLNQVISYLKKELSGRVQQIQLLSNFNNQNQNNNDNPIYNDINEMIKESSSLLIMNNDDYLKIWKQLAFEIELNRFKTLIRIAEYDDHSDDDDDEEFGQQQQQSLNDSDKLQSILLNETGIKLNWKYLQQTTKNNHHQKSLSMDCKQFYERMGQIYFINIFIKTDKQLGLKIIGNKRTPLMIWKIKSNSLAEMNGHFRMGDLILSLDQDEMIDKTPEDFFKLIEQKYSGKWCRFSILRIPIISKYQTELEMKLNFELLYDDPFVLNIM